MRNLKLLLVVLGLMLSVSAMGQFEGGRGSQSLFGATKPTKKVRNELTRISEFPKIIKKTSNFNNKKQEVVKIKQVNDTILYAQLTKRYGWYYGIGKQLSQIEAKRLPVYYRMSGKDESGHFTHIEAVKGKGTLTTEHHFSTYFTNISRVENLKINVDWMNMLQSVVQWKLFASNDEKYTAMEAGYDTMGNQVYAYISTQINDSTFVGHYVDSFGEPIVLGAEEKAPKYLQIQTDTLGHEKSILFIDEDGLPRANSDGAYIQKKTYDENGNTTSSFSCMITDHPMKDIWGNCGWYATYNDRGQILKKSYFDEDFKPVKMEHKLDNSLDVYTRNFVYDNNRLIREYYLTDKGDKDETYEGIHVKEWTYDDNGNILSVVTKDKEGNLCNNKKNIAQTFYVYDKNNQRVSSYFKDKNSNYVNDEKQVCLYIKDNKYTTSTGKDTIPLFEHETRKNYDKTVDYQKKLVHIQKTNDKGQIIESAYYDLSMKPKEENGYFKQVSKYWGQNGKMFEETQTYSSRDTIRTNTFTNIADHTRYIKKYKNNILLSSYGQTLSEDLQDVTGQYGFDALGYKARSHLEDALYYMVKSGTTYKGETSYMKGVNEYGEPAYVTKSESPISEIFCTKIYSSDGKAVLLDEYNKEIDDVESFRDSLNKVICVEIINDRGNKLGLKSGDIIIRYGDYLYDTISTDNWNPYDEFQIETFLKRKKSKKIAVFRYDPRIGKHYIVNINLPAGTQKELGFIVQMVYYTEKEACRLQEGINEYLRSSHIDLEQLKKRKNLENKKVCLLRPYKIAATQKKMWNKGLMEDVIVLGVSNHYKGGRISYVKINDGYTKLWNEFIADCDFTTIYYTSNGETINSITLRGQQNACFRSMAKITNYEYEQLTKMVKQFPEKSESYDDSYAKKLTPQNAYYILSNYKEEVSSFHLTSGDYNFEKIQNIVEAFVGTEKKNLQECYWTTITKENKSENITTPKDIINSIDTTTYTEVDKGILYYKLSDSDSQVISEIIIIYDNSFMILEGNFNKNQVVFKLK